MLAGLLGLVGAGYLALCGLVYLQQDSMLYFPEKAIPVTPAELGLEYEDFEIELDQASVTGWIVRAAEGAEQAPWVLQFHGNAGNIAARVGHLALFRKLGFNGVVFDYRGYGRSRGKPSEAGLLQDALAVRSYLIQEQGVQPDNLVYFGESLGGGVACALAEREPPAGLILKSTFTSVPDMAAAIYPVLPVRALARTRFDNLSRVGSFDFPILVAHGPQDEVVPFEHGRRLFDKAREPKTWVEIPGGHNTGPLQLGSEFAQAIQDFVLSSCRANSR